jgi:hypothetical protein
MQTQFQLENMKEHLVVDGRIILKRISNNRMLVWTGLVWFAIGTSGRFLRTR